MLGYQIGLGINITRSRVVDLGEFGTRQQTIQTMRSPLSCCIMICLSVEVGQLGAIDVISQHVLNLPGAPVILFGDGRFRMPATSVDHYRLIVGKDATIVKTPVKEAGILHGHARRSYDVNVNAWPRPLSTRYKCGQSIK